MIWVCEFDVYMTLQMMEYVPACSSESSVICDTGKVGVVYAFLLVVCFRKFAVVV